ncbi:MAG TPA: metal-dependent hydrolase [Thermoflexia bacterium]|nr:metal-dependent hydrolase [Thermoflexia bacterium]
MKGISHFITGVALATFFPEVVQLGAEGVLLPMLAGIGGILPDTLDFKFARYFEKYDLEIDPGLDPDPEYIADVLAAAMRRAYESGTSQNVMAHTVRLGPDLWREYAIRFDPEAGEVAVRVGPLVNTGQVPYAGTEPAGMEEARRKVGAPLVHTYSSEYKINIFSGPSFRFAREGEDLYVHFLDWHRRWSHSLTLSVVLGGIFGLLFGKWAGLVAGLGFAAHVLEDQVGYMGSNLFWPFTAKRLPGLGLIHSGDAIPNFLTVWTSVALILFNLDRFSPAPLLPPARYLLVAIGAPWLVLGGKYAWDKIQARLEPTSREARRQADIIAEVEEKVE